MACRGRSQHKDRGSAGPAGPLQCGEGRGREKVEMRWAEEKTLRFSEDT